MTIAKELGCEAGGIFLCATGDTSHLREVVSDLEESFRGFKAERGVFVPQCYTLGNLPTPLPNQNFPDSGACVLLVFAELVAVSQPGARNVTSTLCSAQVPLGHISLRKWFSAWGPKARKSIFQQFPFKKKSRSGTIFFIPLLNIPRRCWLPLPPPRPPQPPSSENALCSSLSLLLL